MNLTVTEEIAQWYKKELNIKSLTNIRFFPRYGGFGGHIPGFSIGINNDTPDDAFVETEVEGINFYIEKSDAWYFDNVDLHVAYDDKLEEPKYLYQA